MGSKKSGGWSGESTRHAPSTQGIPPAKTKPKQKNVQKKTFLSSLFSSNIENVIKHGKLEKLFYDRMINDSKRMSNSISNATETLSTADKLAEDTFYSLYKRFPEINNKGELNEKYRMNHDIIKELMSLDEWDEMRIRTCGDELQSAMSTVFFLKSMIRQLDDEDIQKANELQNEISEQSDEMEHLQNAIDGLEGSDGNVDEDKIEEMKKELEEKQKDVNNKVNQLDDELDLNKSIIRSIARESIKKSKEETEAFESIMSGWGIGRNGDLSKVSWKEKVEIAEAIHNNKKIIEMAKMIGQLKRLAMSVQKRKVHKVPEFIEEIETGNNIPDVLPDELAYLGDEELRPLFYKKYSEQSLLQYKMKGHEKVGKGPMIVAVDTSGSMSGMNETWAKSVALALYNVARRQKRPYVGINFSAQSQYKVYEISTENGLVGALTRKGKTSNNQGDEHKGANLIEYLEDSFGSGTDFDTPLKVATDIIKNRKEFKKSDLVFISDGIAETSKDTIEEIEELKSKMKFQIISVAIDTSPGGMRAFSDTIFELSDIVKEGKETAQNIFELV